ncbi:MAG: hypothetical protein ACE5FD_00860 [Anaerolineae bacterium]
MNLTTEFIADAAAPELFDTFHHYKISRNPAQFFPAKLVKWEFRVLTEHTLGIGAQYDWKIWLLGIPVLAFQEQVVAWEAGKRVAYRAISGWQMDFCIDLEPAGTGTQIKVVTDLSLPGFPALNRLLRPLYNRGLALVCRRGLHREGIKTHKVG